MTISSVTTILHAKSVKFVNFTLLFSIFNYPLTGINNIMLKEVVQAKNEEFCIPYIRLTFVEGHFPCYRAIFNSRKFQHVSGPS